MSKNKIKFSRPEAEVVTWTFGLLWNDVLGLELPSEMGPEHADDVIAGLNELIELSDWGEETDAESQAEIDAARSAIEKIKSWKEQS